MSIRRIFQISKRKLFQRKTTDLNCSRLLSALPKANTKSKVEYYNVLGVPPNATLTEIREAYFRKVKECHPDINPSQEAKEQFILVRDAYKILSDVDRRVGYDRHLSKKPSGSPGRDFQEEAQSKEDHEQEIKRKQENQEMIENIKRSARPDQYWTPFQEKFHGAKNLKLDQYKNRYEEKELEAKRQEIRKSKSYAQQEAILAFFRRYDVFGGPKGDDDNFKGEVKTLKSHIAKYTGILVAGTLLTMFVTIREM